MYWDTVGIEKGLYNANVVLNYEGKRTQQDLQLDVKDDGIDVVGLGYVISSDASGEDSGNLVTILVIVIGFLVLLNILWFLVLRKKVGK
jgi:hypothetical protein